MNEEAYRLIEDWCDYDESLISNLGERYLKAQGLKAYSRKLARSIPCEVSNCYPHAQSLAKLIQKIAADRDKLHILDLGCGSGIFARNLLIAIKEMGFLDKVKLVLADFSGKTLKDIKTEKILDDFKDHYETLELDALKDDDFKFKEFDFISMNYLYDSLPTKVLKPIAEGKYQKLQFRFLQEKNKEEIQINEKTLCEDLNLINKLLIDTRWVDYDINEASEIEKKYFDFVKEEPANPFAEVIFNYGALSVTEKMLNLISDNGIVYAADMINRFDTPSNFVTYGNCAFHNINEALIINSFIKKDFDVFFHRDALLNHFFFAKNKNALLKQEKNIADNFVNSSKSDIFIDIKNSINAIASPYSRDIFRLLTQELIKIDKHSCFSKVAQAQDKLNFADADAAQELFKEAQKIDFLEEFNLEKRIS